MNIDLEGIENCEKQKIQFLTKILYEGASCENFVEKELDYILSTKLPKSYKIPDPHPNEVSEISFSTINDINNMDKESLTPWFRMILESGFLEKMFQENVDLGLNKIHNFPIKLAASL